jgi:hypothetical protein
MATSGSGASVTQRDLELCSQPGGHPRGLVIRPAAGERVVQFIEGYCKHHKGEWAGKPLLLEARQKDDHHADLRLAARRRHAAIPHRLRRGPAEEREEHDRRRRRALPPVADGEPGAEVYSSPRRRTRRAIVLEGRRGDGEARARSSSAS